jgi:hypothetical protein
VKRWGIQRDDEVKEFDGFRTQENSVVGLLFKFWGRYILISVPR